MEALSESKGKGVLMFAQRRKRIDEIASEHEELRSKGLPVEELTEAECREAHTTYDKEKCVCNEASYAAASLKQPIEYQKNKMNHLSNVPRPLVPNRTAKPFLRFQNGTTAPVTPSAVSPVTKKNEPRFKVPAPINTSRQVWSPTGDIIASRDERICVPAIKAGILPEPKRKFISKKQSMLVRESDPHLQSKGEQKSYIESEEDCFSLGAEASNFMQPRTIKLKNPPPVPPKPTINPNCPPWRSLSSEPYIPVRSPISQPSYSSVGPHSQHYLQKQDRAQSQHMPRCSASDQTQAKFQPPTNAWAPVKSSSRLHLQPATNSWSQQPLQSPVSMQAHSLTYSPHHQPSPLRSKLGSAPNSVASCPPQARKSYILTSKVSPAPPKGQVSGRGISCTGDGPTMAGKGAELFAKRQSRMEKFVVDSETVQANKTRSLSPTTSLPNSWRCSSNVHAPPVSYKPLLAPFSSSSAAKQAPLSSPKIKPKTNQKPTAAPKHLSTLEGFGRSRSLSLPRRLNSMPSPRLLSPVSTPGTQSLFLPMQRQTSFQEKVYKPPTPWEAASRSPIGSVDEAFVSQSLPSSVASNIKAAGLLKSLPEPPDELKCRVSLDPAAVSKGHYEAPSTSRTFSPEKPAFYGPPFKPAQPLWPAARATIGYMGQGSCPTVYSPLCSTVQRS
uniref:synaptopodin-2 isoform X2 n=1 Tax=Monopterus albus TaxID=43700 RepID=UPI0009B448EE|nr:synaptopodin-2-like isoform X2 [Monopterus albus]